MKSLIKKLLREGLEESINLNLSKELRKLWDNEELDDIFGKNVYRVYYNLETGEQIMPTRKNPSIKMDIPKVTDFKQKINKYLSKYDFEVKDFDKNLALNNKNNQKVKITKVLSKINKELTKKYTTYLDSISSKKSNNKDKLYVVISRHPHDLASKSAKPRITSCEDLRHTTNFNDGYWEVEGFGQDKSKIKSNKNKFIHSGESGIGPTIGAILDNHLIFYLIDEGDWNIQDPHARLVSTKICTQQYVDTWGYGDGAKDGSYFTDFYEFKYRWVNKFAKEYGNKDNKELTDRDVVDYINQVDNITPPINDRSNDIMMSLVGEKKHLLNKITPHSLLIGIKHYYGDKIIKSTPELTNIIKNYVKGIYDRLKEDENISNYRDIGEVRREIGDEINVVKEYKDILSKMTSPKVVNFTINTYDNLGNNETQIQQLKDVFLTQLEMLVNAGVDKEKAKETLLNSGTFDELKEKI